MFAEIERNWKKCSKTNIDHVYYKLRQKETQWFPYEDHLCTQGLPTEDDAKAVWTMKEADNSLGGMTGRSTIPKMDAPVNTRNNATRAESQKREEGNEHEATLDLDDSVSDNEVVDNDRWTGSEGRQAIPNSIYKPRETLTKVPTDYRTSVSIYADSFNLDQFFKKCLLRLLSKSY